MVGQAPGSDLGSLFFNVNSTTNRVAYTVITPSGEAVEMVKVIGQYETYDAENSSYLRLKFDTAQTAWILTAANGTQFIYGQTLQIKDRNGNRITATYDANGLMDTITDTLGRQILLEYGEFFELLKVKQVWNGVTKVLAQFDYTNIQLFSISAAYTWIMLRMARRSLSFTRSPYWTTRASSLIGAVMARSTRSPGTVG